ncbi:unnamed protein product [Meganyctiphanes norvegica]|uniref:Chemosensory protein n=1 Tax=Meganyctiphanes norvegica TaxID=48144 RepID=A0AAV2QC37_MEGNR
MRAVTILAAVLCVAYGQSDCKKDPCSGGCPQPAGNRLLASLDALSPKEINDILVDPARVDFYMQCVLETGACDNTGGAMKEGLREWANTKQICRGCNACQTRKIAHIVSVLQKRYKKYYDAVLNKYQA